MNAHTKSFKTALLIAALAMPMAVFADAGDDANNLIKKNPTIANAKIVIANAISPSTDLATIVDIVTTCIKGSPSLATTITNTAIAESTNAVASIMSAAIGAAPTSAQLITSAAITAAGQNATLSKNILEASINAVTEQAAKNSAVIGNTTSTANQTASNDVLKSVIIAAYNSAKSVCGSNAACITSAQNQAISRAGAASNVAFTNGIKTAVGVSPH